LFPTREKGAWSREASPDRPGRGVTMQVPEHIAIILDGNGRWAKKRGMPRGYGHIKGCENLEKICNIAKDLGVKYLTVYAFSTENWKRSREEVDGLMNLFRNYMKKCKKIAAENQMRVRVIDRKSTRLNSSHVSISYAVFCL